MRTTLLVTLLGGLTWAVGQADPTLSPAAPSTRKAERGESLADAVIRINEEVQKGFGALSPTPITVTKLKQAIESAANQIADSDFAGKASFVNTLTQIIATERIPQSVHFCFTPFTFPVSKQRKAELRNGRHVSISLNYTLLVPSDHGSRLFGLTDIVEVFLVVKPQEQEVPLQPPPKKDSARTEVQ